MSTGYVYLRPLSLVCVRAIGPYGQSSREAWKTVLSWRENAKLQQTITRGYGLLLDNPRVVGPENCRYEASVELQQEIAGLIPDEFRHTRLPGGAYARQRHIGMAGLGHAIAGLRDGWVAAQGLAIDPKRPVIEIHLDDPAAVSADKMKIDICLPVMVASAANRPAA